MIAFVQTAARILSTALITAGLVVLADAAVTLVWQEPVSAAYGSLRQSDVSDELDRVEEGFDTSLPLLSKEVGNDAARARALADRFAGQVHEGEPIGRIEIETIDLEMVMLEGTETATLQSGPGHYSVTPLPGQPGTVAIAGHRTTYLAPFRQIDEIDPGDTIRLELPYAEFTYVVEGHEVVDPGQVEIIDPVGYDRLVLTACHPLYSAAQRWAVFARLRRVQALASSGRDRGGSSALRVGARLRGA